MVDEVASSRVTVNDGIVLENGEGKTISVIVRSVTADSVSVDATDCERETICVENCTSVDGLGGRKVVPSTLDLNIELSVRRSVAVVDSEGDKRTSVVNGDEAGCVAVLFTNTVVVI